MLARRSVAITFAPERLLTPFTTARLPSRRMSAPMRMSSSACMKRFSKIFSVITLTPSATDIKTIICACKSVGNPGIGQRRDAAAFDAVPFHAHAVPFDLQLPARLSQLENEGVEMVGAHVAHEHVAAGRRRPDHEAACLDTVGDHAVLDP